MDREHKDCGAAAPNALVSRPSSSRTCEFPQACDPRGRHRRLLIAIGPCRAADVHFAPALRLSYQREHFLLDGTAGDDDDPPVRAGGVIAEPLTAYGWSAGASARQNPVYLWNRRETIDRAERVAELVEG